MCVSVCSLCESWLDCHRDKHNNLILNWIYYVDMTYMWDLKNQYLEQNMKLKYHASIHVMIVVERVQNPAVV